MICFYLVRTSSQGRVLSHLAMDAAATMLEVLSDPALLPGVPGDSGEDEFWCCTVAFRDLDLGRGGGQRRVEQRDQK